METDWKVAVAAILGVTVIATAVIFSGNENVSGLFTVFNNNPATETHFIAQLNLVDKIAFDIAESNTLTLKLKPQNANIQLGKEKLDTNSVDSVNVRIEGFIGKVSFGNGIILRGSGKKVFLNGIGSKERTAISIDSPSLEEFDAMNSTIRTFSQEASGTITAENGKGVIKADGDVFQLGGFVGGISATQSEVFLDGQAAKISVAGKFNVG